MSDIAFQGRDVSPLRRTDWGAIWAGVFVFAAIWSVFGALGTAIFASISHGGIGVTLGMNIWVILLTVIAMYIAGRETGQLAGVSTRQSGMAHGMVVFGLSLVALLFLRGAGLASGFVSPGATRDVFNGLFSLSAFAGLGWPGFLALFLGWLAAMTGASSEVMQKPVREVREIRPAA